MALKSVLTAVGLASLAASVPAPTVESIYGTESMSRAALYNLTTTIDQAVLNIFCAGQSCVAADFAGSSGKPPTAKPLGGSDSDMACITSYNPEAAAFVKAHNGKPPDGKKQDTGVSTTLMAGLNTIWRPLVSVTGSTDKGKFSGTCSTNILIFAKGTFEPGEYGMLVGPMFTSGLPMGWTTHGVAYDPDIPGDFCLGLPGGMVAKDVINQAVQKCPQSKIYLSGYSQGAMVVRNGLAYADEASKSHVKGIVTFGDPFNGSPVKGWNGPIKIFCNSGDGVCTGNFELAASHLSYGMDSSAGSAQRALLAMAAGGGGGLTGGGLTGGGLPAAGGRGKGKGKGGS